MKDGGPAFPRPYSERGDDACEAQLGISLRDYFAAKAMQGLCSAMSELKRDVT